MNLQIRKLSYRTFFTLLFLCFGIIIALLTTLINYNLNVYKTQKELTNQATSELVRKRQELISFIKLIERNVASLRNSPLLHKYILQPNAANREVVNHLFYALSSSDPALMQVRFIDEHGMEKIRIDWDQGKQYPEIVKEENLQNKAHRYYFIEASQVPVNTFWHSRLDLNIEHNNIEIPHKPVLRIASPVYVEQRFKGIVIINVHVKDFLEKFKEIPLFNIALVDHEGHYLLHYQDQFSWSRYLQTGHTLADDYPNLVTAILQHDHTTDPIALGPLFVSALDMALKKDQAHLLLIPKSHAIEVMKYHRRQALGLIIVTILALSVPLAILIYQIPAKLNQQISHQNAMLQKYVDLIDRNIITATVDKSGKITEASTALCHTSGFTKEELIGKDLQLLLHPDMGPEVKKTLWQTMKTDQAWSGELHNRAKDGTSYWTEATMHPNYGKQKHIDGYTFIFQDTTDKKRIEKLSITDALTGLYNRRFFNDTIKKELDRAMRDKKTLSFVMLDIDFFKQYNDHYGHQKGDEVLMAIGQVLQETLTRSSDFCFRLGGEEFGITFSDLSPEEAFTLTETLRTSIESLKIEHRWGVAGKVITASFGLLSIIPAPGITVDTIYRKADQALYAAKQGGRNRTVSEVLNRPA